jgi:dolichol kinase
MELSFWLNQLIRVLILYAIAYITGRWVETSNIKVNYTRKINHFALFFLPQLMMKLNPFTPTVATTLTGSMIGILTLAMYMHPLRNRCSVIGTMFSSFDRPEDRPFTLFWLSTQIIASYIVVIFLMLFVMNEHHYDFIFIPILINGIGDGLAEPVGIRFGRHAYQTRALFTKKRYTRTLEGSACVFVTSIIAVLLYYRLFSPSQFIAALLIIPIMMTLAEAFSPHSWDSPFLFLIGGISLAGILEHF